MHINHSLFLDLGFIYNSLTEVNKGIAPSAI